MIHFNKNIFYNAPEKLYEYKTPYATLNLNGFLYLMSNKEAKL